MKNWVEEEFKTLSLGDARLDRQAVLLAEQLAEPTRPGPCPHPHQRRSLRQKTLSLDDCPLTRRPRARRSAVAGHAHYSNDGAGNCPICPRSALARGQEMFELATQLRKRRQEMLEPVMQLDVRRQEMFEPVMQLGERRQEMLKPAKQLGGRAQQLQLRSRLLGGLGAEFDKPARQLCDRQQELEKHVAEMSVRAPSLFARRAEMHAQQQELGVRVREMFVLQQELGVRGQELFAPQQELGRPERIFQCHERSFPDIASATRLQAGDTARC
jgi:hypothetical protein